PLTGRGLPGAGGAAFPYRIVDADNHYYEPDDCFTRFLDPAFARRAYRIVREKGSAGRPWFGDAPAYFMESTPIDGIGRPGVHVADKDGRYRGEAQARPHQDGLDPVLVHPCDSRVSRSGRTPIPDVAHRIAGDPAILVADRRQDAERVGRQDCLAGLGNLDFVGSTHVAPFPGRRSCSAFPRARSVSGPVPSTCTWRSRAQDPSAAWPFAGLRSGPRR